MFDLGEPGPGYPLPPLLELRGTRGVGMFGGCGVVPRPCPLAPGEPGPGYPPPALPELRGITGVAKPPELRGITGVAKPLELPGITGVARAPELPLSGGVPNGGVTELPFGVGKISSAGGSPPATGVPIGIGPFVAPAVILGPG